MKAVNYISKKEHKLLLSVAFFTFALACGSFINNVIESYNDSVSESQNELLRDANKKAGEISFGIYEIARADMRPWFRLLQIFLLGLTFLASRKTKRFLLPSLFIFLSFLILVSWFIDYNHAISMNETKPEKLTERLLLIGSYLDFLTFAFVSILLFWQISILYRIFSKTRQNKIAFP